MKITKNRKKMIDNLDVSKVYEPLEAIKILKEKSYVKFNETIDISINLGIDSNKTDQNIKGVVNLPKGSGKTVKVAVVANEDKHADAKINGADLVGTDDLIENISKSKIDFDILIATPDMMPKLGKVAKILGPKGLMPNPKLGTVTNEISQSVKDAKSGQVKFKNDKSGIVHAGVGKIDFSEEDLLENIKTIYSSILKSKPDSVKGSFVKKVTIASTMGIGLSINQASLR
tara:strand:- start:208 stop:897 length:690 start_codon:yes stop_codon:yes gene_type:complete